MITVTVRNHSHFTTLTFPCSENEMEKKLEELDRWDETSTTLFVDKVTEPEELSILQGRFINLDEVNYLAKRMDSFDTQEIKQFFAAVHHCTFAHVKDLINLTFNLSRFTLIQDLSSMETVGQVHRFTLSGGMGKEEMESTDFANIGRELLESGKGKVSEYGILFVNEEIPFDEIYDGQVFPEYYYEACLCTAIMEYRGKTEYAYLPCEEQAIEKALRRMYSSRFSCESVRLLNCNIHNDVCKITFEKILEDEGVFAVNELAEAVSHFRTEDQWNKLAAVTELADVSDSKSLINLARHLDCFDFIPEVQDQEDLARHWIKAHEEYEMSPELEDYFLYEQFGEQIENDTAGMFLPEGGYVYLEEGQSMEEILRDEETENMTLGGM